MFYDKINRLALDNIRRRPLSTSASFCNPVMSRASGSRVFKEKTADWICWRAVSVNLFPSDSDYHIYSQSSQKDDTFFRL